MIRQLQSADLVATALAVSLAFLMVLGYRFGAITISLAIVLTFGMVVWIAARDIASYIIPDGPLLALASIGIAFRLNTSGEILLSDAWPVLADAAFCGGALWLVREAYFRLRGIDGLGFGDVKLALVCGVLVGTLGFAWTLLIASASALLLVRVIGGFHPEKRMTRLPFGAFLAPVCWCLWVFGGFVPI